MHVIQTTVIGAPWFRREIGWNWFSNRVVDEWNGRSNYIVSAETMGSFKRRLDKFMDEDDDGWN